MFNWDMFNRYPYINLTDRNLDMLTRAIREMQNEVKNFVSINAVKYANPIQWNINRQYEKNTITIDPLTGTAFISVQPVPNGVALTRTEYWTPVFDLSQFVTKAASNFANSYERDITTTATMPTGAGDWVVWDSTLYVALNAIHAGDAYVVGGNIKRMTVEDFYDLLMQAIHTLDEELDTEIRNRTNADTTLQGNINAEARTRGEADTSLQSNIDAEARARGEADTTLQSNIDTEVRARGEADTTLQGNIDAEARARQEADAELRTLIETATSYYPNIAAFINDTSVLSNNTYLVTGYYESGDVDLMVYRTTATSTGAFGELTLNNGINAHLVKSNDAYFNVKQYGAYGDGSHNDYTILNDIINYARENYDNSVVYLPQGEYIIDIYLDALRTDTVTNSPRDFRGMTIRGDGKNTLIHGKSDTDRFDVLQINEGCNLNIENLSLTETSTAQVTWGVNGISLTNGCHDITVKNVHAFNLPVYVGGGYVDGGKAFTVQTGNANAVNVTNITFDGCTCENVALGFEFDAPANNNIKYQIKATNCKFDVDYAGIVISFPSFGNGVYNSSATFNFDNCFVRSRQRCVNLSRGSNVFLTNCIFEQYGSPLNILASDTSLNALTTYASRLVFIENCTFLSSFGDYAINVMADGYTPSRGIIIKNVLIGNSFTTAGATTSNSPASDVYVDNLSNLGAPTSFTAAFRSAANTVLNYGGYQIMNNYLMTDKASGKTLGSYTGNAIPIYNSVGSQIGWVPLYS